ncbi:TetR/AcrR family transcriptional regulator [Priestia filamentosa]|uniref:TetR/AcrR family transcriptional regulator n=1 Tax=Priestia filamentosa TaxID=1402861 RepID=UPI003AF32D24
MELIKKKGFKGTTTREISNESGVNESTLFRHFKNKKGISISAFEQFSYIPTFSKSIREGVQWYLEEDLLMFSRLYQQILRRNENLIVVGLKEKNFFRSLNNKSRDF